MINTVCNLDHTGNMERLKLKTCTEEEKHKLLTRCTELDFTNGQSLPFIFRVVGEQVQITDAVAFYTGDDRGTLLFEGLDLYLVGGDSSALSVPELVWLLRTTLKGYL